MTKQFLQECKQALQDLDFDAIESLREGPVQACMNSLALWYTSASDWEMKDLIVHLIQDCGSSIPQSVLLDALNSPTPDTRAVAIAILDPSKTSFESLLSHGSVDSAKVDEAIKKYRQR